MTIPFRIKRLTKTAKLPTQENQGDLWDLYADNFSCDYLEDVSIDDEGDSSTCYYMNDIKLPSEPTDFLEQKFNSTNSETECLLNPQGRILVKTGIAIELFIHTESETRRQNIDQYGIKGVGEINIYDQGWQFNTKETDNIVKYAVADIRPRSGLALKHGITVLNTPGTIDNSYRKEIGVILINQGHEPYTIKKGDKVAQMLIRPLYPSKMQEVNDFEDTGRGGFGSSGRR